MSLESARGLVIRAVEFSETSLVVTLFTREHGKIGALAKGGRRLKGPFESALDLLSESRLVFLRKSSDALDLLTEAKLERRFRPAGRDLSNWYGGYYVAELLNELTDDSDPQPELFDAARVTLARLSSGGIPVGLCVLRFELLALRTLGHLPLLEACVECGGAIPTGGRISFGLLAGGALCSACRPGKKQVVSLSAEAMRLLRTCAEPASDEWFFDARSEGNPVMDSPPLTPNSALSMSPGSITRSVAGEARGLVNQYLCALIGRRPRMHAYTGLFLAGMASDA